MAALQRTVRALSPRIKRCNQANQSSSVIGGSRRDQMEGLYGGQPTGRTRSGGCECEGRMRSVAPPIRKSGAASASRAQRWTQLVGRRGVCVLATFRRWRDEWPYRCVVEASKRARLWHERGPINQSTPHEGGCSYRRAGARGGAIEDAASSGAVGRGRSIAAVLRRAPRQARG